MDKGEGGWMAKVAKNIVNIIIINFAKVVKGLGGGWIKPLSTFFLFIKCHVFVTLSLNVYILLLWTKKGKTIVLTWYDTVQCFNIYSCMWCEGRV